MVDAARRTPEPSKVKLRDIARVARMMWLGFEETALQRLREIATDEYPAPVRVAALSEIARWHATFGRAHEALATIDAALAIACNDDYTDDNRALAIDLLTTAGRVDDAAGLFETAPPDFKETSHGILRRANLVMMSPADHAAKATAVLDLVNGIFSSRGVSPVLLRDENAGLSLENLCGAAATGSTDSELMVSVVMPAYNAANVIGYALRGLVEQTWRNLEIIVVDDGSTDATVDIANAVGDPRIRVVANDGKGAYAARNFGLTLASGRFVTIHDADDWSHPEKLERQVIALQSDDSLVGTLTACARTSEWLAFVEPSLRPKFQKVIPNTSSFMMHKFGFELLGPWDNPSASADNELIDRCRRFYGPDSTADVLPDVPLSFCLRSPTSLTSGSAGTGILSRQHCIGARRTYMHAYTRWHDSADFVDSLPLDNARRPRPIRRPRLLDPSWRGSGRVDVAFIGDFTTVGDSGEAMISDVRSMAEFGVRVGLTHVPLYEPELNRRRSRNERPLGPVSDALLDLVDGDQLRFVTSGEVVDASLLLIRPAYVLRDFVVGLPTINAASVAVVISEPATAGVAGVARVDLDAWVTNLTRLGHSRAAWYPETSAVRAELCATAAYSIPLAATDWLDRGRAAVLAQVQGLARRPSTD